MGGEEGSPQYFEFVGGCFEPQCGEGAYLPLRWGTVMSSKYAHREVCMYAQCAEGLGDAADRLLLSIWMGVFAAGVGRVTVLVLWVGQFSATAARIVRSAKQLRAAVLAADAQQLAPPVHLTSSISRVMPERWGDVESGVADSVDFCRDLECVVFAPAVDACANGCVLEVMALQRRNVLHEFYRA
ncbi:uncharacterized protein EMH_0026040 [Eimeria mitis]|uniref:Uncharacterized protein n=1 Tax=Eimeria mitis TaxID=44415 RepID=U6KF83_9EIME|nr:uncharacterized protein EMH_0026040 [Eimeria mitis]CDJ35436.1 hypothetical protein EMH_0026040 [Eimeria mitis]